MFQVTQGYRHPQSCAKLWIPNGGCFVEPGERGGWEDIVGVGGGKGVRRIYGSSHIPYSVSVWISHSFSLRFPLEKRVGVTPPLQFYGASDPGHSRRSASAPPYPPYELLPPPCRASLQAWGRGVRALLWNKGEQSPWRIVGPGFLESRKPRPLSAMPRSSACTLYVLNPTPVPGAYPYPYLTTEQLAQEFILRLPLYIVDSPDPLLVD